MRTSLEQCKLASQEELSRFLVESERRAYKQALFAVHDEHLALDIVQDAMIKLAEKYGGHRAEEFPMLFQRILQNGIRDHYRRQKVRSAWSTLMSALLPQDSENDHDPLEFLRDEDNPSQPRPPDRQLEQAQTMALIEETLKTLPARQREAFLLRYWDNLDTAETAAVMGCSVGSVKTHALAAALKAKGISLS